jgi:hypothetical protein
LHHREEGNEWAVIDAAGPTGDDNVVFALRHATVENIATDYGFTVLALNFIDGSVSPESAMVTAGVVLIPLPL